VLSRQNLPVIDRGPGAYASAEGVARGGYTLADTPGTTPDVLLIATGSEVQLALEARDLLAGAGLSARVVSMPCREWFAAQPQAYREQVLRSTVRARGLTNTEPVCDVGIRGIAVRRPVRG
jgi:transketolase